MSHRYYCRVDGDDDFEELVEADGPVAAVRAFVRADECEVGETTYLSVHVRAARPDETDPCVPVTSRRGDWYRIRLDPPVPPCTAAAHEWALPRGDLPPFRHPGPGPRPGIRLRGAGTVTVEVCRHCGWYRITDTVVTDPADGSILPETVTYFAPDDASRAWIRSPAQP